MAREERGGRIGVGVGVGTGAGREQGGGTGVEAASAVEVKLCGNKQCQLNERCNPDYTAAYFNFNYATIIYPGGVT